MLLRWAKASSDFVESPSVTSLAILFAAIRGGLLDSLTVSSLMNDLGFAQSIIYGLRHVLLLGEGHEAARQQQLLMGEGPRIQAL